MTHFTDTELIYKSLHTASEKIQEFLDNHQISEAHGDLMLKLEELHEKMYALDLEAIKNTSEDLHGRDNEFKDLHNTSKEIINQIDSSDDFMKTISKVFSQVDKLLTQISKLVS